MDEKGFDKIAFIRVLDHLGEAMMPVYICERFRLLGQGGVTLNHSITLRANTPFPKGTNFARKYVSPDGEPRPPTVTIRRAA